MTAIHHLFFGGRRRRVFGRLAALSGVRPGDKVLDVGCGTGYFTRVMAEAVASGGTVVGVDPSREVIARARRVTRMANCTFSEGTAEALDAAGGSYDAVVSSLMIHHLPETLRPQAIREMFRVLRDGEQPGPSARTDGSRGGLRAGTKRRCPPLVSVRAGREANRRPMTAAWTRTNGPRRCDRRWGAYDHFATR